jgi:hypothetical protein
MENKNKQTQDIEWNYMDFLLEIEYMDYLLSTRSYNKHYYDRLEIAINIRIKIIADRIKTETNISNNIKQLESLTGLLARYIQLLQQYHQNHSFEQKSKPKQRGDNEKSFNVIDEDITDSKNEDEEFSDDDPFPFPKRI